MTAALGTGDGMDLVDDHRLDRAQCLAPRGGGEQEEQALGRRDQDVGRRAGLAGALLLRGIAGAHADVDVGQRQVEAVGGGAQAGKRAAEVALDVVVEGLERRDVQDPRALLGSRRRGEPIERHEKRSQRLARAGRCAQEHVAAAGNGRPAPRLRRRGPVREGFAQPGRSDRRERGVERVGGSRRHGLCVSCGGCRLGGVRLMRQPRRSTLLGWLWPPSTRPPNSVVNG